MPTRIRLAAMLAVLVTLAAPITLAQQPQQQNNGPGGGGGGFGGGGWGGGPGGGGGWGGGGGPGGRGGPGGGGMSQAALIVMPVIQEELKLTDKQKDQIKQTSEEAEKKRTQVREKAQKLADEARVEAAMQAAAAAENGGGAVANNADENGNGNNGGGRGGRNRTPDAGQQIMRQTLDTFQTQVEAALLKPLDPKQKTRLKQLALQAEGVRAFRNPEVIEKLVLTEEQAAAINAISNSAQQSQGRLFQSLMSNNDNGDNGGNGGNNGGGRGGRGMPDQATIQTPEFQAKLKTMQTDQQKLDDQTMATVGKALTKAQKATFNKMIGDKFDMSQIRNGFMARFLPPAATPATTQASAAKPATATPSTTTATPAPATPPAATTTTKTTKKSLRDARGGSSQP